MTTSPAPAPATDAAPTLHIRPLRGWINDPNGVIRHAGRWHVFFQHNPLRAQWGTISWGHASSADLVTWDTHPLAFGPQPDGPDRGGCWSGSSMPWLDRPAVAYTGVVDGPDITTVCVRTALDDSLDEWSDPVVVAYQPADLGVRAMRDPFPFEWRGRRFAVLGAGLDDGTPALLLFSCDDPLRWRSEGVWLGASDAVAARVAPADIWECPQLARFDGGDVLVLSLQTDRRLEDVVHLVGTLEAGPDGLPRFVAEDGGKLDDGPDFYAPHLADDGLPERLLLGWVRQEDAPEDAPADALAGCLTLPRRLALQDGRLTVSHDPALEALSSSEVPLDALDGNLAEGVRLPPRARAVVRVDDDQVVRLHLRAGAVDVVLDVGQDGHDIWLDGEVAEIFRPGTIAATARAPGSPHFSLTGRLDRCELRVFLLQHPADPREPPPT